MEQKAVCGGFLVGDGLEFEGKTLKATGGSGGKIYTYADDAFLIIKDAGKDIESIMANGGFTVRSYDDDEGHDVYEFYAFNGSVFYQADRTFGYRFYYILAGVVTEENYKIVGDDLVFIDDEP